MTDDRERSLVRVALPAGDPARDGVALVTLDRREARNALSFALLADLDEVLAVLDDDDSCRAIVITGAGERAFAAGADIRDLASSTRDQLRREDPFAVVDRVGRLRTPVIAAVRGYALGGGCELAMACTIRIAADTARIGQPEINLGIIPGYAGTQRLTRLVGRGRALEMLLTGDPIGAHEAHRIGLVNRVVPPGELLKEARALAATLASKAPVAVRYIIDAVNKGLQMPFGEAQVHEATLFGLVASTEDMREGTKAFLEKRKAEFKGR
jgi:enoyl-CoA hydratase